MDEILKRNELTIENNKNDYIRIDTKIAYNSLSFNELNKTKVEDVYYLIIKKGESLRFCLPIGINNSQAFLPFSAPFGYPETLKKEINISHYDDAICLIEDFLKERGGGANYFQINFPPLFYDENVISTWINTLINNKWIIKYADLNFAIDLKVINSLDDYYNQLTVMGRNTLKHALNDGFEFRICENELDKQSAYGIIKLNKQAKNRPLWMTYEQVNNTMEQIKSKWFIVEYNKVAVASALVYQVSSKVAQIIYWGDIPNNKSRAMNYLAYSLVFYCKKKGYEYLDVGISTEDGVKNYGLCFFKESVGCSKSIKLTLCKNL